MAATCQTNYLEYICTNSLYLLKSERSYLYTQLMSNASYTRAFRYLPLMERMAFDTWLWWWQSES